MKFVRYYLGPSACDHVLTAAIRELGGQLVELESLAQRLSLSDQASVRGSAMWGDCIKDNEYIYMSNIEHKAAAVFGVYDWCFICSKSIDSWVRDELGGNRSLLSESAITNNRDVGNVAMVLASTSTIETRITSLVGYALLRN